MIPLKQKLHQVNKMRIRVEQAKTAKHVSMENVLLLDVLDLKLFRSVGHLEQLKKEMLFLSIAVAGT